jgi:hypothetical protein
MRLILLSLAGAACLAACTPAAEDPADPPEAPAAPAPAPAPAPLPTPPTPSPDAPPADACGAAERQGWVGQPRSAVPATPAGADWRIFETGQPVTQDLRPDRLNVEIDPATQRVVSVRCG